jgi:heme o synthase
MNSIVRTEIPNIYSIPKFRISNSISVLTQLIKIRITILVSLTTALGFIFYTSKISYEIIYPVLGIFFLACGSAALNQYQEKDIDSKMQRTKNRPIPSGQINPINGLLISVLFLISGSLILVAKTNILTLSVGLFTFYWYNFVYTPLKKISVFAVIPGSLVGALPPIAGWVSAGGYIFDFRILYTALYFFIWQIPHFWLLILIYSGEYKNAELPSVLDVISKSVTVKLIFLWILVLISLALGFIFSGICNSFIFDIFITVSSLFLLIQSVLFLKNDLNKKSIFKLFMNINVFTLLMIIFLSLDKLLLF